MFTAGWHTNSLNSLAVVVCHPVSHSDGVSASVVVCHPVSLSGGMSSCQPWWWCVILSATMVVSTSVVVCHLVSVSLSGGVSSCQPQWWCQPQWPQWWCVILSATVVLCQPQWWCVILSATVVLCQPQWWCVILSATVVLCQTQWWCVILSATVVLCQPQWWCVILSAMVVVCQPQWWCVILSAMVVVCQPQWLDFLPSFTLIFHFGFSLARDDFFCPSAVIYCGFAAITFHFFNSHSMCLPHTGSGTHRIEPGSAGHQWWVQQGPDGWGAAGGDKTLLTAPRVVPESPDPSHVRHAGPHLSGPGACCQLPQALSQLQRGQWQWNVSHTVLCSPWF